MSGFRWVRRYAGPVKSVVLDFSGTTCDKYVIAPAIVFAEVFKRNGVEVSMDQVRGPMGLRKDLHILALLQHPEIGARWKQKHGREGTEADAQAMYREFVPLQLDCLRKYGTLLPGTADTLNKLRRDNGIKLGVTTGFTRVMVDILLDEAKKQGFVPDAAVGGDDVKNGVRPKPFMLYRNLELMDSLPIQSVIKVDDTSSGIGEGLNAGCWTVGVARYSNYMNINSLEEEASLSAEEIQRRVEHGRERLRHAGAHYVVDDINALPDIIRDINSRLAAGEMP